MVVASEWRYLRTTKIFPIIDFSGGGLILSNVSTDRVTDKT